MDASKVKLCEELTKGLTYFDVTKQITLSTDWSGVGIAFVMRQKHCSCTGDSVSCCTDGWKIVLCNSKLLKKAENGYAPIEGEALAVAWGLKKARYFLLGVKHFTIETDHKPLVPILSNKSLESIENGRLLRLKEKTIPYNFTIRHIEGKSNILADTLSRYPVAKSNEDDEEFEEEFTKQLEIASITAITNAAEALSIDINKLKVESLKDEEYMAVKDKVINHDFASNKNDECELVKAFYLVKDRLSVSNGLLMYSFDTSELRLVIPRHYRPEILKTLHAAHQGVDAITRRARQTVYWPGISKDILRMCSLCKLCIENAPSLQKEEMISSDPCEYPFQHAVADLFQKIGHFYIAYADRYTAWIELEHFRNCPTSSDILSKFREWFHHFGIPEQMSLDGGRNILSKETREFFNKWGVDIRQSSAYYPKSNGRAEAAVKTMKRVIEGNIGPKGTINNDNIMRALLQYRNTPLKKVNKSPAQLLLGRQLRDGIPQPSEKYHIHPQWENVARLREKTMAAEKLQSKEYHDSSGFKNHKPITVGQQVVCQNARNKKWDRIGTVVEQRPHRQYLIKVDGSGRTSLRNRVHLKPLLHVRPHTPILSRANNDVPGPTTSTSTTSCAAGASTEGSSTSASGSRPEAPVVVVNNDGRPRRQRRQSPDRYGEWIKH